MEIAWTIDGPIFPYFFMIVFTQTSNQNPVSINPRGTYPMGFIFLMYYIIQYSNNNLHIHIYWSQIRDIRFSLTYKSMHLI